MERYKNLGGNSNVLGYEIGQNFISVWFKGGKKTYTYSYGGKAGKFHVDKMKLLASSGSGLNGYIKLNVNNSYD
ncbi:MAG: hypothetical protein ACYC01_06990 [Lutibacter sp.]